MAHGSVDSINCLSVSVAPAMLVQAGRLVLLDVCWKYVLTVQWTQLHARPHNDCELILMGISHVPVRYEALFSHTCYSPGDFVYHPEHAKQSTHNQ